MNENKRLSPSVSLCTYIYNDGELANGLLAAVEGWTHIPNEIILVDDASSIPYEPVISLFLKDRVRLIRFDENGGPAKAKAAGMNAAKMDYILSMDCDMRIDADWLEQSLPLATKPEVGMVGVSVVCQSGEDIVSQYMSEFGHQMLPDGEADFLSGNVWLMRRAVWDEVGGFGSYIHRTHEDHYYCNVLKQSGYKLYSCAQRPGKQVRNLSRHAVVRRFWTWQPKSTFAVLLSNPGRESAQAVSYSLFLGSFERIEYTLQSNKHAGFVYLELLLFVHGVFSVFKLAEQSADSNGCRAELLQDSVLFWQALSRLLKDYSCTLHLLENDINELGHPLTKVVSISADAVPENGCFWTDLLSTLYPLTAAGGIFEFVEKEGLAQLLSEEERVVRNFSFYEQL